MTDWVKIRFTLKCLLPRLQENLPSIEEYVFVNKEKFGVFASRLATLSKKEQEILRQCIEGASALLAEEEAPDYDKVIHQVVAARANLLSTANQSLFVKLLGSHFGFQNAIKQHRRTAIVNIYGRGGKLIERRRALY